MPSFRSCTQALMAGALLAFFTVQVAQAVPPQDFHWEFVEDLIHDWIDHSSCPTTPQGCNTNSPDNKCKDDYPGGAPPGGDVGDGGHWDWNGETGEEKADCVLFPKRRNPFPLGSRLLRLAFHDAMGTVNGTHTVDGHLDLYNENATKGARNHSTNGKPLNPEHNALDSAIVLLDDLYAHQQLPIASCDYPCDCGGADTCFPMATRLTKADFYAWAYLASVTYAAAAYTRVADLSDNGWAIPKMAVRFGYKNQTQEKEVPPPSGANTQNGAILQYFEDEFDFDPQEVVALMGAHTLGGGRLSTSGHSGMWTQSKTQFNTEYFSNLADPKPLSCPETGGVSGGVDTCTFFSDASCDGGDGDRCQGWEQVSFPFTDPFTGDKVRKVQWRHSCTDPDPEKDSNDRDCAHLMLNVDMALYRHIDTHLCVDGDNDPICDGGSKGFLTGKVKSFPHPLPEGMTTERCNVSNPLGRILATCFHKVNSTASHVETLDDNITNFLSEFAAVFNKLLDMDGLELLTTTGTPCTMPGIIANGDEITEGEGLDSDTCNSADVLTGSKFACCSCQSGLAKKKAAEVVCLNALSVRRSWDHLPPPLPVYSDSEDVEASDRASGRKSSSARLIVIAGIFGSALTIFGVIAGVASRSRSVDARGRGGAEKTLAASCDEDTEGVASDEERGDEEC